MEKPYESELPAFFAEQLGQQYSPEDVARIEAGCAATRKTTLRANTLRTTRSEVVEGLNKAGIDWSPVAWYADAFVLDSATPRELWELPLYKEGRIYLQSLSSMLPPLVLGAKVGHDVLDMCAAPGGKTTQLAALCNNACNITACEMHAPRAEKLQYNLQKQGATRVNVMRTDARQLDEYFSFDRILLDAPCSGSGTINIYDPKLSKRFNQQLIQKSCKAQTALLTRALALLKPGAELVYSTCSVLACENEHIVQSVLAGTQKQKRQQKDFKVEPIELATAEGLPLLPTSIEGSLCVCPTEFYEGFFMCKIKRTR